ncbi:deoxyribose-phosphate aldolase [Lachnospiraceae bacterium YSD2013]|nr:deoxyribose-phosphate aldolase [Lachnospiraceae bacterium]MBO4824259.1 deoxyribose-phosphate aldolase [Lachnospiraceae bacterium]SCW99823.1 deoxyribose-phosphate aldolase [Lachnospiraceae bacterium YSD2013]
MTKQELYSHVDHTQLKAFATWEDIVKLCDEAVKYKTASVCVPPCYIKRIHDKYGKDFNICTVIGFPLGYSVTAAKVVEAKEAIKDGANEVDMVININDAKNGDFDKIEEEIKTIKAACGDKILKVIIETCYLTDEEKIKLCGCVTRAKAEYIKTSTGFGTGGATFDDVKLFKEHVGPDVKIKAAGGIRTKEDMETFLSLGADRLGTSSAISILEA